jgi:hypothetical protein
MQKEIAVFIKSLVVDAVIPIVRDASLGVAQKFRQWVHRRRVQSWEEARKNFIEPVKSTPAYPQNESTPVMPVIPQPVPPQPPVSMPVTVSAAILPVPSQAGSGPGPGRVPSIAEACLGNVPVLRKCRHCGKSLVATPFSELDIPVCPDCLDHAPQKYARVGEHLVLIQRLADGPKGFTFLAFNQDAYQISVVRVFPTRHADEVRRASELNRCLTSLQAPLAQVYSHGMMRMASIGIGAASQAPFLEVEYLPQSSRDAVAQEPKSLRKIAHAMGRLIATAAKEGILIRDIQPGNIRCGHDFKLADSLFLKRLQDRAMNQLTGEDGFKGPREFSAPEMFQGNGITSQADIFSLAGSLYFLASGKKPFEAKTFRSLARDIMYRDPDFTVLSRCPISGLAALIQRGMSKNACDRPKPEEFIVL